MEKKWMNNLGLKLLSIGLAAILWIVIVNIDDPPKTKTFRDVEVKVLNEDTILNRNQVYEIVEGKTVDITIKGKRSVIEQVYPSDLQVTADLANLIYTNAVPIDVSCTKFSPSYLTIELGKVKTFKVALEDVETKQFKVDVIQKGTVEEGYCISQIQTKPKLIQVTGAQSQIARIAKVIVEVDVSNASEDFSVSLQPKVYDEKGKLIDSEKMSFSTKDITVKVSLLQTKTVPLTITTTGEPAEGYRFKEMTYEPQKIEIAGNEAILKNIVAVPLTVDITDKRESMEEVINVEEYLPEGVILADSNTTVAVKIEIVKLLMREFILNANEIDVKNLPSNTTFRYVDTVEEIRVQIMGLQEEIEDLSAADLNAYIDLSGLEYGEHKVSIKFPPVNGVKFLAEPTVVIELLSPEQEGSNGDENNPDGTTPENPDKPDSNDNDTVGDALEEESKGGIYG